jgi:hypothetical protein
MVIFVHAGSLEARQPTMTLAPIRGAPPGAAIPDFPSEERAKPVQLPAESAAGQQPQAPLPRRRETPIEIGDGDLVLTFRVIPEIPAIARPSLTIEVAADPASPASPRMFGTLRMSAANARAFLTDLRNGRSPVVATGDEGGSVQIECEFSEPETVVSVLTPGGVRLHRLVVEPRFDIMQIAAELLADLGA